MAKRKRQTLPRVTIMAFSKRDMITFADAVDKIISTQHELDRMLVQCNELAAKLKTPAMKAAETRRQRAAGNGQDAEEETPSYATTSALV